MLSKIILKNYSMLVEIAIWVTLIGGTLHGARFGGYYGQGAGGAIMGGITGLFSAFVFSVAVFGGFLILNEIRTSVKAINDKKQS